MLTFEQAMPEDLEPLYALNKGLIDQYEDLTSIDYPKVLNWVGKNLEHNLPSFTRIYQDGILAGYYCLSSDNGKMELDSLFTFPESQGQGIGTAVLKKCMEESEVPVFLYVFKKNIRAFELYRRMGFRVTKEMKTRYIMEYQRQDR